MGQKEVRALVTPLLAEGAMRCELIVYRGEGDQLLGILLEPFDETSLTETKRIKVSHLGDITEMFQTDV
jgi:hypothetical protein